MFDDMTAAIKDAFNRFADFSGRSTRPQYWYFYLFVVIAYFFGGMIDNILGTWFVTNLFLLALLVPSISTGVRRMHDIGMSGWFLLIPIYNIYLLIQPTKVGANA